MHDEYRRTTSRDLTRLHALAAAGARIGVAAREVGMKLTTVYYHDEREHFGFRVQDRRVTSQADLARLRELVGRGRTKTAIARELGLTRPSVYYWCSKLGLTTAVGVPGRLSKIDRWLRDRAERDLPHPFNGDCRYPDCPGDCHGCVETRPTH